MKNNKIDKLLIGGNCFPEIKLIDVNRLNQIKIAEEMCQIIHRQALIISGLQQTENQRAYIADLYQAILDVARSFVDERIDITRGEINNGK